MADIIDINVTESTELVNVSALEQQGQPIVASAAVPEQVTVVVAPEIEQVIVQAIATAEIINIQITEAQNGLPGPTGPTGPTGPAGADVDPLSLNRIELLLANKLTQNLYAEFVSSGGNITQINYWASAAKSEKLFTKDIIYTNGNPTTILITDNLSGHSLSTIIAYNGSEVSTITKTWN
ncbi:MAG: hypothetical protein ACOYN4_15405 [Bacteroidales bacterium]